MVHRIKHLAALAALLLASPAGAEVSGLRVTAALGTLLFPEIKAPFQVAQTYDVVTRRLEDRQMEAHPILGDLMAARETARIWAGPAVSSAFTIVKAGAEFANTKSAGPPPPGGVHEGCIAALQSDGSRRIGAYNTNDPGPCPETTHHRREPTYERPSANLTSTPGRPCIDENGGGASCSDGTYISQADQAPPMLPTMPFSLPRGGSAPEWVGLGR
uniref:Uncharacterized protein n=1 Tax=Rhodopseudomonas palustris (strain DX-1) TaxID=652103 RepID=E6VP75_RHOPX